MRLNVGAIEGNRADHPGGAGQSLENLIPDTLEAPPVKAVVDRRMGRIPAGNPAIERPSEAYVQCR